MATLNTGTRASLSTRSTYAGGVTKVRVVIYLTAPRAEACEGGGVLRRVAAPRQLQVGNFKLNFF